MFSSNSNEIEFFVSFDNKKKNDFHVIYYSLVRAILFFERISSFIYSIFSYSNNPENTEDSG